MKQRYTLLQWYRGFAAMLVVLYHFEGTAFNSLFSFGWAGVDFFFVLSGFIITYVHYNDLQQSNNLVLYLKKRLIRIYPVYWIISTLVLISIIALKITRSYHLDFTSASGILYLIKCYLLIPLNQDYFVIQAWTLGYEVLFYLLFFIALAIGLKKGRYLLVVWVGLILANQLFIKTSIPGLNTLVDPINLEFVMGMLVAYYVRVNGFKNIPNWLFAMLIITLLAALKLNAMYLLPAYEKRNFSTIILLGLLASVLLIKLTYLNSQKVYKLGILGKLGEASYTLYLIHHMLFILIYPVLFYQVQKHHLQANLMAMYGICVITLIAEVGVAYVFYLLVEVPVLGFLGAGVWREERVMRIWGVC